MHWSIWLVLGIVGYSIVIQLLIVLVRYFERGGPWELIGFLDSSNAQDAMRGLKDMGERAIGPLAKVALRRTRTSGIVQLRATQVLCEIGTPLVIGPLLAVLGSGNSSGKAVLAAAYGLRERSDPRITAALLEASRRWKGGLECRGLAGVLASRGEASAVPILVDAAHHEHYLIHISERTGIVKDLERFLDSFADRLGNDDLTWLASLRVSWNNYDPAPPPGDPGHHWEPVDTTRVRDLATAELARRKHAAKRN